MKASKERQIEIVVASAKRVCRPGAFNEPVHVFEDTQGNIGLMRDSTRQKLDRGESVDIGTAAVSHFLVTIRPKRIKPALALVT
jgi:2-methylcitrate dehydratase PrpD